MPRQYLEWCKLPQDKAPTGMGPGEAEAIARAGLADAGHPDAFEWWEEEPCGVASIGQVHRARLTRAYGSKDVVVTVQAPGLERKFRSHIRTCTDFSPPALPHHGPPLGKLASHSTTALAHRPEANHAAQPLG